MLTLEASEVDTTLTHIAQYTSTSGYLNQLMVRDFSPILQHQCPVVVGRPWFLANEEGAVAVFAVNLCLCVARARGA